MKIKPSDIKLKSLVKFINDDGEWNITSINLDKRTLWAISTNSPRKTHQPMSKIVKLDRKPVEVE